jgi:hypothetical protein
MQKILGSAINWILHSLTTLNLFPVHTPSHSIKATQMAVLSACTVVFRPTVSSLTAGHQHYCHLSEHTRPQLKSSNLIKFALILIINILKFHT